MANWYVSSVGWTAVTAWAATTAYTVGQYRRQLATPAVNSERVFRCTTAGTSGGTEPSWNLSDGATTTDGTAVWTNITGQEAHQSAGNWTAPFARQASAGSVSSGSDVIFIASNHAETQTANLTIGAGSGSKIYLSVNSAGSTLPPTATDLLAGASIVTTSTGTITLAGLYGYGLTISAGSGASTANIATFGTTGDSLVLLDTCALILGNTSATSAFTSDTFSRSEVQWINTTFTFGAAGQKINMINQGDFIWRGPGSAVLGVAPTALIGSATGARSYSNMVIEGVDLSNATNALSTANPVGQLRFVNCRLAAGVTVASTVAGSLFSSVKVHNCDDSANSRNYRFYELYRHGSIQQSTVIYRTGGASDGVTSYSHQFNLTSDSIWSRHLTGNWIAKRWNTTGSAVTLTMEFICFLTAPAKSNQVWIDVDALTTAAYPQADCLTTATSVLDTGTSLAASTEIWDSGVTARANSTAYIIGNLRKVASNSGRVFVCTTAGTSAGSEPGAFASAVDGGAVTDNTVTWRACYRHKITKTFTPQMAGMVKARLHVNIPISSSIPEASVYFDPKLMIV